MKLKLKKKVKLLILIICLLCLASLSIYKYLETQKINSYLAKQLITTKKTNLYSKNKEIIGSINKDIYLEIDTKKKGKYFKIKNTNYYIYYKDTKKVKEKPKLNIIPLDKNIKTTSKTTLNNAKKEAIILDKGINLPIKEIDANSYEVIFSNNLYTITKSAKDKIIDHKNSDIKKANQVSVLFYDSINDTCSSADCTTTSSFVEEINTLKDNNYSFISLHDFNLFVKGNIALKENSILMTTTEKTDLINNISKDNNIIIEEETNLLSTNKPASSKDPNNRYQIKNSYTKEDILEIAQGKEKEIIINDDNRVPVLNYHFFYDPNQGESCNEGICLEVSKLREHLSYLKDNHFKALTMEEFKKWMYGEIDLPEKSVLITIDDGAMGTGFHNGNKLIPMIEEFKMPATLFLIAGWWDIANYKSDYLTIQSHTYDMHQYGPCKRGQINCATYEEAKADLQKSLDIIGNNDSFCFPFYMYSDTSIKAIQDSGFKLAFIGGSRKVKRSDNKFLLPRYPIHSDITLDSFKKMVD